VRRTALRVKETAIREKLLPLVQGRIFHVTRLANLDSVLRDGRVRANCGGTLPPTFGSSTLSYFRQRGCVCLFDLFHCTAEQQAEHLTSCWPFSPATVDSGIAIFALAQSAYDSVITYSTAKADGALNEMIVPYVEAGFKGDLSLSLIDEVIEVEVDAVPRSPLRLWLEAFGR
jgi:hypothetical protein